MRIRFERAREIVSRFGDQRILVVGDLMLDRYIVGTVERISPEAPVPVVRVTREDKVPGGAANVAMNIRSLGGGAMVAGVVGADHSGRELLGVLKRAGIRTEGVLPLRDVRTTVKTRVLAEHQQVVRVDWEDKLDWRSGRLGELCRRAARQVRAATGVILDDYDKGVIRQEVVDAVLKPAQRFHLPVGYDPKRNHGLRLRGVTLATPNCKEAHEAAGFGERHSVPDPAHDSTLQRVAQALLRKWKPQQLIVTLGPQGMYLVSTGSSPRVIPTKAREVYDVSGAGDTVIAACLLAVAAGASCEEAAILANYAAGVVVGKLGTATCSQEELLACIREEERIEA